MNFDCPYCNRSTTITTPNEDSRWSQINIDSRHLNLTDTLGVYFQAIVCPNTECRQVSFIVDLTETARNAYNTPRQGNTIHHWQLLPESTAKIQPEYIPHQILADYNESCRIKELSPKASATLSRRCLQGMIRDFWGIKMNRLVDEINALEEHVSPEVWASIDAVRSVGNIGAHMEKDVNTIIDIEPGEADLLITLIEDLFKDWYVTRHNRQERQKQILALAESKKKPETKPHNKSTISAQEKK